MGGLVRAVPFVGRERELVELAGHLEAARAGRGGVVLIGGEPGIGKTRLMLELAARAETEGTSALIGRAYESEGMPPYLPFIEALRDYVRTCTLERLRAELGAGAPEVALLVPEVRTRLTDLPVSAPLSADEERYRLFEGIADFLLRIASASPDGLLLGLDDLHWADKPTLLLLQHLARKFDGARLLVVGTYRTVDLDRTHPLADMLAELSRARLSQRLSLHSFSLEEASAFVQQLYGAPAAPAVVVAIYGETEGNPFFIEEVVRQLCAEGRDLTDPGAAVADWGIPEGVRQVIGRRLSRLSFQANRLLQAGAVLGEGFSFDVLGAMAGAGATLETAVLLDALEEALGAGMLREEASGYQFTHALIRQTLEAELSLPRKQRLHLQAAQAIERIHARNLDLHVAELAFHCFQSAPAGGTDMAIDYAVRAGEQARAIFAYEEAARFYEMALQVLDFDDALDPARRCDLLLALGEALGPAGAPQQVAEEVTEEAFALAEALGDAARATRSAWLAIAEGLRRYGGGTVFGSPLMRRWVARLDRYAAPGTRERVEADLEMGILLLAGEGRWADAWARIERARTAARQFQDVESLVVWPELRTWMAPRGWEEDLALTRDVAAMPREFVNPRARRGLLNLMGWTDLATGDRAAAEQAWQELDEVAAHAREAVLLMAPLIHEGLLALLDGDLEGCAAAGERVVARAEELGSPVLGRQNAYTMTFRALLYLGRADEALAIAFAARQRGGWADRPAYFRVGERALCLAHLGCTDEARAELAQDLSRIQISEDTPIRILAALLETAVMLEDREAAARLAPLLADITGYAPPLMSVALRTGTAAALLGDRAAARAHFERSLEWATRLRYRPEIALTRLALAELLLAGEGGQGSKVGGPAGFLPTPGARRLTPERAAALERLDFAVEEFRAMRMQPALERGLSLRGGQRLSAPPPARPSYPGGLSMREIDVLRLIAAGRSNRDIAKALVISHNTVVRHVSHIFAKTGVANRVEAATYATRHGLVEPS